ncbi:MAG: SusC/RagA family TonB-linked outer membrane protein [Flavobacteriales bacterium]
MKKFYPLLAACALLAASLPLAAQTIKGKVTGPDKTGMVGAVVRDLDGNAGAATDLDGNYDFVVTLGTHKIEFSYIGYTTVVKEISISAGQTLQLDVQLEEDPQISEEVVVVGYGVQRKRDVTGSISKVEGKDLVRFPAPSFEAALQGQAAGVQVTQGSGLAGSGSQVRVRGVASVSAGGDPLYVVDGIPITQDQFLGGNSGAMNTNPLASINPNDIESVEILKDAAATGIYGSRGANGVILITTKRGKQEGMEVTYNTRFGLGVAATLPNMLNTDEYLAIRQEAWENDGGTGYVWLPNMTTASDDAATRQAAFLEAKKTNTDWVKETTGIGFKTLHSVGLTSRKGNNSVYANLTYDYNGSYLLGNSYERVNGRLNWDHTFSSKFKMMTGLNLTQAKNKRINAAWSGGLGEAMSTALPYYKVYNDDGTYYTWNNGYSNPVMYREERPWVYFERRALVNLAFIYTPVKDLNIKLAVNGDGLVGTDFQYFPVGLNPSFTSVPEAPYTGYIVPNYNGNLTVDYTKTYRENHNLTFLAGTEYQESSTYSYYGKYLYSSGLYYTKDGKESVYDSMSVVKANGYLDPTQISRYKFGSAFGRVNYNFNRKYYLQAVARADISSKFGPNKKLGFFPSISGGWVISEEKFLKDSKTINFMKLRAGWGIVGNSNLPQNAQFADRTMAGSYNNQEILYTTKLPNPNLHWEKSTTMDLGIEAGLWKDRVTTSVEFYRKQTTEGILSVSIPQSTGFGSFTDNVAKIMNQGIEWSITAYVVNKLDFQWKTSFNIARNWNELQDIGKYTPDAVSGGTNDSRVIVGKPVGSFYLMDFSHIDPQTGKPVYLDVNGNETNDYTNFQRRFVGTGLPKASGGFSNTFTYKRWQLSSLATFTLGAKIFDSSAKRQLGVVTDWNMRDEILDRWRQPGDDATFPVLTLDPTTYQMDANWYWWNTDLFVFDASYVRLKNIELAYNFDVKNMKGVKNMRVAFNVTNLFTITKFPGLDPEIARDFENEQDRNLSPNITYLTPPQERSYNLAFAVTF